MKEAWSYNILFMNGTVGREPILVDEQDTNMTVDSVARINLLMNRSFV